MGLSVIEGLIKSVAMTIVSEIGDKTFIIAALMAMKHPRRLVLGGAFGALAIMTMLSAIFGWAAPNLDAGIELCRAAASGDLPYLSRLVKYGVDPNVVDYGHRTPLHVAAAEGNPQVTEVLVKEGADVFAKDRRGFTPLDEARVSDDQATIQLLESEVRKRQEAEVLVTSDVSMQGQDDEDT